MKAFIRLVLLSLVLIVVALISALTAMRLAIHGAEVVVPNVVGKTPTEAARLTEAVGLPMAVERQFYSADVPEGRILSQAPQAGARVRRGWQVRVSQSLGPQRIEIPNVLGQSERAAELNIRRRGLEIAGVAEIPLPGVPAEQVLAQSPLPNATGVSTPKISLLATQATVPPSFVMPSLIGQPLGSATQLLKDAGLKLGNVTLPAESSGPPANVSPATSPATSPASIVISQIPLPGQRIIAGAAVSFEVRN